MPTSYDTISMWYEVFYGTKPEMNAFYASLAQPGLPVLDLGCGTGRVARALVESGFRVVGIDNSRGMLEKARVNRPDVGFRLDDIREFDFRAEFPNGFGLIMAPWDVVLESEDRRQRIQMYKRALEHLAPHGRFAFDTIFLGRGFLSNWGKAEAPNRCVRCDGIVSDPDHPGGFLQVFVSKSFAPGDKIDWTLFTDEISPDGSVRRMFARLQQTYVSPVDTESELTDAGFGRISVYGSFSCDRLYSPDVKGKGIQVFVAPRD